MQKAKALKGQPTVKFKMNGRHVIGIWYQIQYIFHADLVKWIKHWPAAHKHINLIWWNNQSGGWTCIYIVAKKRGSSNLARTDNNATNRVASGRILGKPIELVQNDTHNLCKYNMQKLHKRFTILERQKKINEQKQSFWNITKRSRLSSSSRDWNDGPPVIGKSHLRFHFPTGAKAHVKLLSVYVQKLNFPRRQRARICAHDKERCSNAINSVCERFSWTGKLSK
jgi:hypothetical protein